MCNTYCFMTATVVMRTRFKLVLYLLCLSCFSTLDTHLKNLIISSLNHFGKTAVYFILEFQRTTLQLHRHNNGKVLHCSAQSVQRLICGHKNRILAVVPAEETGVSSLLQNAQTGCGSHSACYLMCTDGSSMR